MTRKRIQAEVVRLVTDREHPYLVLMPVNRQQGVDMKEISIEVGWFHTQLRRRAFKIIQQSAHHDNITVGEVYEIEL